MMKTHKIMISGFGGQGVILIGQIVAHAGMLEGKEVTWMPSYGPEMRGGTAHCTVIISEKRIASPVITEATAVVALNRPSLAKFQGIVAPGGHLFINTSLIKEKSDREDVQIHNVDCNKLASEVGNDKTMNMVMLGALIRVTGVVSLSCIEKVMEEMFTGSKAALLQLNKKALEVWK
jgi:2-oxoglutarate ferredoxin oxidoreductase subunit gamma